MNYKKELPYLELIRSYIGRRRVVLIRFKYNSRIISEIKKAGVAQWNSMKQVWVVNEENFNEDLFRDHFSSMANISEEVVLDPDLSKREILEAGYFRLPEGYLEKLQIKRYSSSTLTSYTNYMLDFIMAFEGQDLSRITPDQINAYIIDLIETKNISRSQQNQRINAIKFYYEKVLGKEKLKFNIERPKTEKALPKILTENEILAILRNTENIKHKAIIATLYSAGLRRSELLNLRKQDVLFDKGMIFIRGAKGKKDRTTVLAESTAQVLKKYMQEYRPNYWMFEGPNRNKYSASSVLYLIKNAAKRAGINRHVTPHMFRHSFATHLMDQNVDSMYIQKILGHASIKTTEIYTHVSKKNLANIISPLDRILNKKP